MKKIDSSISEYIQEIKKNDECQILNDKEFERLFKEYKNGSIEAFNKLINCNLRLVINIALKFNNKLKNIELIDIIQEGNIGLINALNHFDIDRGVAFSTYAYSSIERYIQRFIDINNNPIRAAINMEELHRKYWAIIYEYRTLGKEIPSDEELCELLKVTKSKLDRIKEMSVLNAESINKPIKDDYELEETLGSEEDSYVDIEEKEDNLRLLITLKKVLRPIEYYVIYNMVLYKTNMTLESIGDLFNVTYEYIRQIKVRALNISKDYISGDKEVFVDNEYFKRGISIYNVRTEPISYDNVLKYLYVKDYLSDEERKLLYFKFFGRLKDSLKNASLELMCSIEEINVINISLENKIKDLFNDCDDFEMFSQEIRRIYGTSLFDLSIINQIPSKCIRENDLNTLFEDGNKVLSDDEKLMLANYFDYFKGTSILSKELIERDVYLSLYDLKGNKYLKPSILYNAYIKYSYLFSREESLFLEGFFFSKVLKKKSFLEEYPNSKLYNNHKFLITKLEMLHYGINDLFSNRVDKNMYLSLKEKYNTLISKRRVLLLDLYFGVSNEALSVLEISKYLNEDYEALGKEINTTMSYLENLYSNSNKSNYINKDVYIMMLKDKRCKLDKKARKILELYLIDNLSYKDIADKLSITNAKVTNIVNNALQRLDYYRFGIIETIYISKEELEMFFESSYCLLSDKEKNIVLSKFFLLDSDEDILCNYNVSSSMLIKIKMKFNKEYLKYKTKDMIIMEFDIFKEINRDEYDSILDYTDKTILSLYYNLSGERLTLKEIAVRLGKSIDSIKDRYNSALINIKARMLNLIEPDLKYIDKDKLDKIIDDKHLPLDKRERDVICYLCGLKGYTTKSISELETILGVNYNSVKRIYKNSIVTIYKYLNNEIEGNLDFEEDISDKLKYFSKRDASFIIDYYKNGLTCKEISDKYNVSINILYRRLEKLKFVLTKLSNGIDISKFDFDYYRSIDNYNELPFYGNLDLARDCFELYTGESTYNNYSLNDIKNLLNLDGNDELIRRNIYEFILSIYKYRDGFRKRESFTRSDINKYFLENKDKMSKKKRELYLRCLSDKKDFSDHTDNLSDIIMFDLLKDKDPNLFDINTASKEEVIELLKKYRDKLNEDVKRSLMTIFKISEREIMNKNELNKVLSLIRKVSN